MRRMVSRRRVSVPAAVQAPVGGWNAFDPIGNMPPGDAVILDNWFPATNYVALRSGCSDHVTGISGSVETLAQYAGFSTTKFFGAAGANIYDVTTPGVVGAPVVTGATSARWQQTNFATPGGSFLYLVNGSDSPELYDGTTWTAITGVSVPAITGVTTSSLINVCSHQSRLWFIERNSMNVWYLPVSSIGGAATQLNLSSVFKNGGNLVAMGSWTIDSGSGMDDHAVFVTSEGEVAVYQGYDPSSINTWALKGVYYVGEPVGYRCLCQYGSDLLIITQDGLLPLSKALLSSRVSTGIALTEKIQFAISSAISGNGNDFGWETSIFPKENMLVMNIPQTGGNQQYVMNTITGAWCRFTGWDAECFSIFEKNLYFGTDGKVCKAWDGVSDSGVNIDAEALQAFSYFESPVLKYFVEARPILASDLPQLGILLGLNVDFDITAPIGTPTFSPVTVGVWDSAIWDQDVWGGGLTIRKDWQTIGAVGYAAALHMMISTNQAQVQWASTGYIYEPAQGLT